MKVRRFCIKKKMNFNKTNSRKVLVNEIMVMNMLSKL